MGVEVGGEGVGRSDGVGLGGRESEVAHLSAHTIAKPDSDPFFETILTLF